MKKANFNYLKTMSSLENCIDCVENDVAELTDLIEGNEELKKGATTRVEHLKYWIERLIEDYEI